MKIIAWHLKLNAFFDVWKKDKFGGCEVYNQEVFDDGYCANPVDEITGTHYCLARASGIPGYISSKNCVLLEVDNV